MGSILGCLEPILTVSACLSYKSPFSKPFGKQEVRHPSSSWPPPHQPPSILDNGIPYLHIKTPPGAVYTNTMLVFRLISPRL